MATIAVDARPVSDPVPLVRKHHWLVRVTHWINIPLLLGLTLSGMSIYWAAPVYKHAPHDAQWAATKIIWPTSVSGWPATNPGGIPTARRTPGFPARTTARPGCTTISAWEPACFPMP